MPLNLISDDAAVFQFTQDLLLGREPIFIGRIGGSDTSAVAVLQDGTPRTPELANWRAAIERYNGFYDRDPSPEKVMRFVEAMTRWYASCPVMTAGAPSLLTLFFPEKIDPTLHLPLEQLGAFTRLFERLLAEGGEMTLLPYTFVEKLDVTGVSMMALLGQVIAGKRVLVVSPFGRTVEAQRSKRHAFFRDYAYPEFELLTLDTPITYAGLAPEAYPERDWFETAERLQREMAELDFDIALLSCGSYAMPLGCFARDQLGKKAVYVGGVLQLYFGVMGRRFEAPFYQAQINAEVFVRPSEGQAFRKQVEVPAGFETEAFGAYF